MTARRAKSPPPTPAATAQAAIDAWFASNGWTPFAFQREVWESYARGESGLIHAATGTGMAVNSTLEGGKMTVVAKMCGALGMWVITPPGTSFT